MRIFSRVALAAALSAMTAAGAWAAESFKSANEAFDHGVKAYERRAYDEAIPALEFAAAADDVPAQYYLARIYADDAGAYADAGKAYMIFQQIADEHTDADPDDDRRAAYVGKSFTALAAYLKTGVPGIGVQADPARAAEYLRFAALFFRDEDAQFELAKMQLTGDAGERDAEAAKHWLAVLSRQGHAGAQAFLADLYWRGQHMERDPVRALSLANLAVANAHPAERVWIEDIYQAVFCASQQTTREEAARLSAQWRGKYVRDAGHDRPDLAEIDLGPQRSCGNGEAVMPLPDVSAKASEGGSPVAQAGALIGQAAGPADLGVEAQFEPGAGN